MVTSFILCNSFWNNSLVSNNVQTDFWCSSHRLPVLEMWSSCLQKLLALEMCGGTKYELSKNENRCNHRNNDVVIVVSHSIFHRIIRIEIRFLTSSISAHELNLATREIIHLIYGWECSCICATVSKIILQSFNLSGLILKTDPVYSRIATATYSLMNRR